MGVQDQTKYIEKAVMLQTLDGQWKEHLAMMDYLRQGIHMRGFAQKNPKQEYKREAFAMFSGMLESIKTEVIGLLSKMALQAPPTLETEVSHTDFQFKHDEFTGFGEDEPVPEGDAAEPKPAQPYVRPDRKIGRNEPCPCGSGKKYKQCHGKLQ